MDLIRKIKEQAPGAPGVFSKDFNKELAQRLPGACSIDLKEDSIMELEGTFSRGPSSIFDRHFNEDFIQKVKGIGPRSCKCIAN